MTVRRYAGMLTRGSAYTVDRFAQEAATLDSYLDRTLILGYTRGGKDYTQVVPAGTLVKTWRHSRVAYAGVTTDICTFYCTDKAITVSTNKKVTITEGIQAVVPVSVREALR